MQLGVPADGAELAALPSIEEAAECHNYVRADSIVGEEQCLLG